MSHIVQIRTEVRDVVAMGAACRRLGLVEPVFGEAKLFSTVKQGWQVRLPNWPYPVVVDVNSGAIDFDNFGGNWGNERELQRFLQSYAIEKASLEARKRGHSVIEQALEDGSVKLTISVGGAA